MKEVMDKGYYGCKSRGDSVNVKNSFG